MALQESEKYKRREFGESLKKMLKKNGIKITDTANALGVTQGYMSQVISGMTQLQKEKFEDLTDYLSQNISEDDICRLTAMYYNARAGDDIINTAVSVSATTTQRHFLHLFEQLTCDQQMAILNAMLQYIDQNKTKMAEHAGLD